jgi:hypothetical protein
MLPGISGIYVGKRKLQLLKGCQATFGTQVPNFMFADHTPGTVPVVVRNTQLDALNEFRPVLARCQSTSWNRSRSRP